MVVEINRDNVKTYLEPNVPRKGGIFLLQISKKVQNDTEFRKIYIEEWENSINHTKNIQSLYYAIALGCDAWQNAPIGTSAEYKPIRVSVSKKMKELGIKKSDSYVKEILLIVHPNPYTDTEKNSAHITRNYHWKPFEKLLKELEDL